MFYERDQLTSLVVTPSRPSMRGSLPRMVAVVATSFDDFDGDVCSVVIASLAGLRTLAIPTGTWVRYHFWSHVFLTRRR